MATHMPPMDQYTSISKLTNKSSNTENSKELTTPKPNNNKKTKRDKKEISKTLLFGKPRSPNSLNGPLLGEKEDQDGTFSVQLWPFQS